jgi:leucyl-tRNA synthetase
MADCAARGTSEADIEKAEKVGIDLGISVKHPFDPNWTLPVWAANFVLSTYGTGAIFGSPAGDQRDIEFAEKYQLPFKPVVLPAGADPATYTVRGEAYTGEGTIYNSEFLDGLSTKDAITAAIKELVKREAGEATTQYRLRDWGVSRQRYWGCPIPVIKCAKCGTVPVPDKDLPVLLPDNADFSAPGNPLVRHPDMEVTSIARPAAARPSAKPTRWIRSSTRPGTSRASPIRKRRRRSTRKKRATGCPSINTSAASSTRCSTCSIPASSPARCAIAACSTCRAANPSPACSRKAWSRTRPTSRKQAHGSCPKEVEKREGGLIEIATMKPVTIGRRREDVEVEEERRRSDPDHRRLRRRRRPLVRPLRLAARARLRMV